MKSALDIITRLCLRAVQPVIFGLINSKPFLLSSRYFMRIFNPKRDIPVNVNGMKMYANSLDRLLALLFWKYALVENYEMRLMQTLIQDDMVLVNCGANIGYYALQMAKLAGPNGKVYAFEPDPNSLRLLRKNIAANGLDNIIGIEEAISDKVETRQLFFCEENRGDHRIFDSGDKRKALEINSTSLDAYFSKGEKIDLIKMDIQGSEALAIEGMLELIARNPDLIILSEFCPTLLEQSGSSGEAFLARLEELDFEVEFIDEEANSLKTVEFSELLENCKDKYYCSILIRKKKLVESRLLANA